MKRSINFFGTTEKPTRVRCHVDGISIPGIGSLRLGIYPKIYIQLQIR